MKIYNISLYEKLKIRPVDVNSMQNECRKTYIEVLDAESLDFSDLDIGYIVKTKETDDNPFYMMVDIEIFLKITGNHPDMYRDEEMMFIQEHDFNYLSGSSYMSDFPCCVVTKQHKWNSTYDITKVYIINPVILKPKIKVFDIKTRKDFVEIYDTYIQYIKNYENNKSIFI